MSAAKSFRDLLVWQQSHQWVLGAYRVSKDFPKAEIFGLTSQLRRSASSVPPISWKDSNVVEKRTKFAFIILPKHHSMKQHIIYFWHTTWITRTRQPCNRRQRK